MHNQLKKILYAYNIRETAVQRGNQEEKLYTFCSVIEIKKKPALSKNQFSLMFPTSKNDCITQC